MSASQTFSSHVQARDDAWALDGRPALDDAAQDVSVPICFDRYFHRRGRGGLLRRPDGFKETRAGKAS